MRGLLWLLGAAAASVGAAALLKKRSDAKKLAEEFLAAVKDGRAEGVHDHPEIGGGRRMRLLAGFIDKRRFVLLMQTDKNDAVRRYGLVWKGRGLAKAVWNPLKGDDGDALHEAYALLVRHCGKGADAPN